MSRAGSRRALRVLVWHVHGSWTTAFVQGRHTYLLPVLPDRGPDGRGRAQTWDWPANAVEVTPEECAGAEVDVVVLQRRQELGGLAAQWLGGRRPGIDVPAVYVEHNAPQGRITAMRHPVAGARGVVVVHVTHFNRLLWDAGPSPTTVIEHGIVDPGYRYTAALPRGAVVINEPLRRGRVTGTDLLDELSAHAPLDVFGMGASALGRALGPGGVNGIENLPQDRLHDAMAKRRVYVHPVRWTSLGLSLLEAMHLGMPVVALATTEVPEAVPPEAGVVSNRPDVLAEALRRLSKDPDEARERGMAARRAATTRYGLRRFLDDWDVLLEEVCR